MKKIFPKDIMEYSLEMHRCKNLRRSKSIYLVLLIGFALVLLLTPFMQIDLYTKTPGMIRPNKLRNLISSPINGKVLSIHISENVQVKKGDTLLLFDDRVISKEIALIQTEIDTIKLFISDLNHLSKQAGKPYDSIVTTLYKSEYRQYLQKIKGLERRMAQKKANSTRQLILFKKGVIAKTEFQRSAFELELSKNKLSLCKKEQKSMWQNNLNEFHEKLNGLKILLLKKTDEKSKYLIKASIEGSIQDFQGIEAGNFVRTGERIAEISPQAELVVECFMPSSQLGLLETNDVVRFQIDAFPHNHWGMANGRVLQINRDVSIVDKLPVFKITCSLDEKALHLNDNTLGKLRKGMTLSASFLIAKRSLLQLFSDKIADWYN